MGIFLVVLWAVFSVASAVWVFKDADARRLNAIGWAFGVLTMCWITLPCYLFVRRFAARY